VNGERENGVRTAASQATPGLIHVCTRGPWRVLERGTGVSRRWSVRGTLWLGSRRGVVITSRSDRVPLLSRRHTPAEKQNGTSDRPTDRPTNRPFPLSFLIILLPLARPPGPRPFLLFLPVCLSVLRSVLPRFRLRRNVLEKPSTRRRATRPRGL